MRWKLSDIYRTNRVHDDRNSGKVIEDKRGFLAGYFHAILPRVLHACSPQSFLIYPSLPREWGRKSLFSYTAGFQGDKGGG